MERAYTPYQRAIEYPFLFLPYLVHMSMLGRKDLRVIVQNNLPSFLQIVSLCLRIEPIKTDKAGQMRTMT